MKYRKKPIVIEAFKFGTDFRPQWFDEAIEKEMVNFTIISEPVYCEIKTLEGVMRALVGDYIILGIAGEIYPCKSEIFEATYEKVE